NNLKALTQQILFNKTTIFLDNLSLCLLFVSHDMCNNVTIVQLYNLGVH
ncbi:39436_t:CDS:2, partial [Gigaspora margarita]